MVKQKLYTRTLTLPNGKRKYFRAKTKEEVERKVLVAKMQMHEGIDISDNTTFAVLAQQWYDIFKKDQLHEKSLEAIKGTLNRYVLPQIGQLKVRDIRPLHVQRVMKDVSHLSQSAQRKTLNAMRAIFNLAIDSGLVGKSPITSDVKAKGAQVEQVTPLTRGQVDALLAATRTAKVFTFILLTLFAGLRKGEALGVKWEDIDFDSGVLRVRRSIVFTEDHREGVVNEELKTSAARRDLPLPFSVVEFLSQQRELSNSEYVLSMESGAHLSESSFNSMWGAVKRRYAVNDSKKSAISHSLDFTVHPHQLRHTCITRWFETGLDLKQIQYLAGHATVEMTLRVYAHYDRKSREEETAEKVRAAAPSFLVAV